MSYSNEAYLNLVYEWNLNIQSKLSKIIEKMKLDDFDDRGLRGKLFELSEVLQLEISEITNKNKKYNEKKFELISSKYQDLLLEFDNLVQNHNKETRTKRSQSSKILQKDKSNNNFMKGTFNSLYCNELTKSKSQSKLKKNMKKEVISKEDGFQNESLNEKMIPLLTELGVLKNKINHLSKEFGIHTHEDYSLL